VPSSHLSFQRAKEAPLIGNRLAATRTSRTDLERVRQHTVGELHAGGARRFENVLRVGIESVDLDVDQLSDGVGSMRTDVVVGCEQLPHTLDRSHMRRLSRSRETRS